MRKYGAEFFGTLVGVWRLWQCRAPRRLPGSRHRSGGCTLAFGLTVLTMATPSVIFRRPGGFDRPVGGGRFRPINCCPLHRCAGAGGITPAVCFHLIASGKAA